MPAWGQWLLGAAAIVTALAVIWSKVIKPLLKFAKEADRMIPLLQKLTDQFIGEPTAFSVLAEIAAQFKSDSGSTLRDAVDRLDKAATENKLSAEVLKVELSAAEKLAERDRQEIQRLILKIDRVTEAQKIVADNLSTAQTAVDGVAEDLKQSHLRADEVHHSEPPGTAADAASKPTPSELKDE